MNSFFIAPIVIICLLMLFLDKIKMILSHRFDENFSPLYVLGLRLLVAYLLMQRFAIWSRKIPTLLINPSDPSIFFGINPQFFTWLAQPYIFSWFNIIFAIVLFCFALEIKPKLISSILLFMLIIAESYTRYPHSIYIIGLLAFSFVVYYAGFRDNKNPETKKLIFPISFFFIGTLYFSAFLSKSSNLPAWFSGESLQAAVIQNHLSWILVDNHLVSAQTIENFSRLNLWELLLLQNKLFAVLSAAGTVLLHFISLFLVILPQKIRSLVIVLLILFHISVYVTFGLPFFPNIIILSYLICDWFALFENLRRMFATAKMKYFSV